MIQVNNRAGFLSRFFFENGFQNIFMTSMSAVFKKYYGNLPAALFFSSYWGSRLVSCIIHNPKTSEVIGEIDPDNDIDSIKRKIINEINKLSRIKLKIRGELVFTEEFANEVKIDLQKVNTDKDLRIFYEKLFRRQAVFKVPNSLLSNIGTAIGRSIS
ncbi:MAG: hypothetical protein JXA94_00050 [Parachlamydiales bacterium]|nr:hypothetical protein [Parachlamydiales bacterium]